MAVVDEKKKADCSYLSVLMDLYKFHSKEKHYTTSVNPSIDRTYIKLFHLYYTHCNHSKNNI